MKATTKIVFKEDVFALIEASKLHMEDKFMQYEPKNDRQRELKERLKEVIAKGIKDFYHPRFDPSFDSEGRICFKRGMYPALGESYNWWVENAVNFDIKRKSRLGTKSEYIAFLGVLLKLLVQQGENLDIAWYFVCNDSKLLGHYLNTQSTRHDFEVTGSRITCGFYDLANTWKILRDDDESNCYWIASGYFDYTSYDNPIARMDRYTDFHDLEDNCGVGWIVLEE